ncbi:2-phosphosulfolactate phosphatase [Streptomyces xanthii]|uniref:Probable 2-phosphosulfolactate phosphatase n=1 Tax=Streptomyces xanthii TaxID=2768069 RepID=A0A7H1BGX6_9ACTN|nr:2-phosphosulfolactate phosphatase [Streptomyces xanthii]QNS07981.1 2-phosphosulfolactate phosphatase [Streptomyces xanthii]
MPAESEPAGHGVYVAWGPAGAARLAPRVVCLVVVDVLSFTTAVTVAVAAGTRAYPYRWRDAGAAEFAERVGARLAVGRSALGPGTPWSLSPASLRRAPFTPRLVLPSPNGSTVAAAAAAGTLVVASCLRNASAVGRRLTAEGLGTPERPVAVIAAGERAADGTLRLAEEDLLGAGATVAALEAVRPAPSAVRARDAFLRTPDVRAAVADCPSAHELYGYGFREDVEIATEADTAPVVPVLVDGAFTDEAPVPRVSAP